MTFCVKSSMNLKVSNNMKKARVFEETFNTYLQEIGKINLHERAYYLGAEFHEKGLVIPFYDDKFLVTTEGIFDLKGSIPTFAIKVVLCKYVLMSPQEEVAEVSPLVTYREFKDSGPLTSYFANNTNKTLEVAFSGKITILKEKCMAIGGIEKASSTYDFSVELFALPKIPVILNFNDKDEMFPAGCSILYQASAERFLDMECLAITGTYLTGILI